MDRAAVSNPMMISGIFMITKEEPGNMWLSIKNHNCVFSIIQKNG